MNKLFFADGNFCLTAHRHTSSGQPQYFVAGSTTAAKTADIYLRFLPAAATEEQALEEASAWAEKVGFEAFCREALAQDKVAQKLLKYAFGRRGHWSAVEPRSVRGPGDSIVSIVYPRSRLFEEFPTSDAEYYVCIGEDQHWEHGAPHQALHASVKWLHQQATARRKAATEALNEAKRVESNFDHINQMYPWEQNAFFVFENGAVVELEDRVTWDAWHEAHPGVKGAPLHATVTLDWSVSLDFWGLPVARVDGKPHELFTVRSHKGNKWAGQSGHATYEDALAAYNAALEVMK